MKALAILLLLDYSGSMEQPLEGKTKFVQAQSQLKNLSQIIPDSTRMGAFLFGSQPENKCRDITYTEAAPQKLYGKISKVRPGKFGKTPLAKGLLLLTEKAVETRAETSLAITDGTDTCGDDPCVAAEKANRQLAKANHKFSIFLVGYDLKNPDKKLLCLKNLKLSHLNIFFNEANSLDDLAESFKQLQLDHLNISAQMLNTPPKKNGELLNPNKKTINGINNSSSQDNDGRGASASNNLLEKSEKENETGFLEITGAPAEAQFILYFKSKTERNESKEWTGGVLMPAKAGQGLIKYLGEGANEKGLEVQIPNGQILRIPWALLLSHTTAAYKTERPLFGLKWIPTSETQMIHGELQEKIETATFDFNEVHSKELPFGYWDIDVTSPIWLKGLLPKKRVYLKREEAAHLNLYDLFKNDVRWMKNPHSDKSVVLKLLFKDGRTESHLLPAGQKLIPYPLECKAQLLY